MATPGLGSCTGAAARRGRQLGPRRERRGRICDVQDHPLPAPRPLPGLCVCGLVLQACSAGRHGSCKAVARRLQGVGSSGLTWAAAPWPLLSAAQATHIFDGLETWPTHFAYLEGGRMLRGACEGGVGRKRGERCRGGAEHRVAAGWRGSTALHQLSRHQPGRPRCRCDCAGTPPAAVPPQAAPSATSPSCRLAPSCCGWWRGGCGRRRRRGGRRRWRRRPRRRRRAPLTRSCPASILHSTAEAACKLLPPPERAVGSTTGGLPFSPSR